MGLKFDATTLWQSMHFSTDGNPALDDLDASGWQKKQSICFVSA
jgi:hypothetical protein